MHYAQHSVTPLGLIIDDTNGAHLRLEVFRKGIIRISHTQNEFVPPVTPIVVAQPDPVSFEVQDAEKTITLSTSLLRLVIDKRDLCIAFYTGERLLVKQPRYGLQLYPETITIPHYESGDTEQEMKHVSTDTLPGSRFWLRFEFAPNEHIYGLGSGETGLFDRREGVHYLYQQNYKAPVPFFSSNKGYGVLIDTGAFSSFSRDFFGQTFFTDSVEMGDFYFIYGGNLDGVVRGYRTLTGDAPLLPKWLYGYTQSKEHYHTQQELLDTVHEYRRRRVPLDLIVQDWYYWPEGTWSDKSFDLSRYPDAEGMCREVHDAHARIMISVWPNTSGGESYRELREKNQLLGDGAVYNVWDEAACETYWQQIWQGIGKYGFDAWWCDCSEPYEDGWATMIEDDELKTKLVANYKEFMDSRQINLFSLLHCRNLYEKQRRDVPDRRMVNLTRSGYAGQQRYSGIVWSGDISASWIDMRNQAAEGMNYCASGLPYWTLDIGGFFPKDEYNGLRCNMRCRNQSVDEPSYRELYTRWLEFGCFLPMFRSHGHAFPREIWQFGEEGTLFYDSIRRFIELRYRLLPYLYSLAWKVTSDSYTLLRMLAFDFPNDEHACITSDEFMFGPALLICPVFEPMYYDLDNQETPDIPKKRTVYLPSGADWQDYWTGERYAGGTMIEADAPIERIPIYLRSGSILPTTQVMQYVDEHLDAPYTLLVCDGADADFTIYEDGGDSYDYEKGDYAVYDLHWDDKARMLSVSDRKGSFPGMVSQRELIVKIGDKEQTQAYTGKALRFQF